MFGQTVVFWTNSPFIGFLYITYLLCCSPRLHIDGATHYGALVMTPAMEVKDSLVYVGGVAAAVPLSEGVFPVLHGLIGGLRALVINDR